MSAAWKTVRVFISSTFRDMHAERDHLVTVVFPELRERVEQLGLEFFDVDLRWGVTKDQTENDQALAVCLQRIEESRPFFIAIVGERYGYVPQGIDKQAGSQSVRLDSVPREPPPHTHHRNDVTQPR